MTTAAAADAAVETKATSATPPIVPAAGGQQAGVSAPAAPAAKSGDAPATGGPAAGVAPVKAAAARLLVEDTKPAEVTAKSDEAKATDKPALTLKAAEGSSLSADDVKAIETFATENGLSQAQAEKILAREEAGRTAAATRQSAEADRIADVWLTEAKAHPEIGGDKLDAAVANAKRALGAFATPEERKAIAASPFANNPLFLAILNRAAKALPSEDTVHAGAVAVDTAGDNPAHVMYPKHAKR